MGARGEDGCCYCIDGDLHFSFGVVIGVWVAWMGGAGLEFPSFLRQAEFSRSCERKNLKLFIFPTSSSLSSVLSSFLPSRRICRHNLVRRTILIPLSNQSVRRENFDRYVRNQIFHGTGRREISCCYVRNHLTDNSSRHST